MNRLERGLALALLAFLVPARSRAAFVEAGAAEARGASASAAAAAPAAIPSGLGPSLAGSLRLAAPTLSAAPTAAPSLSAASAPRPVAAAALAPLPAAAAAVAAPAAEALEPAAPASLAAPAADVPTGRGAERTNAASALAAEAPAPDAALLFDGASARRALEDASRGAYTVTVLRKGTGDGARYAVLLGEAHQKSAAAAAAGDAVIARFPRYALESYDATSTWARRFNWALEMRARKRIARRSPSTHGRGSSIHAASRRLEVLADVRAYVLGLPAEERERLLSAARVAVAAGEPGQVTVDSDDVPFLDAAGILAEFGGAAPDDTTPTSARRRLLEIGHVPDAAENVAVWKPAVERALPWALAQSAVAVLLASVADAPHFVWAATVVAALVGVFAGYMMLGEFVMRRWRRSPLGVLFPFETGIVRARDRTMASNLAAAVNAEPGPWLAVMGGAHLPGVRARLIERHGFEEASLDELERAGR